MFKSMWVALSLVMCVTIVARVALADDDADKMIERVEAMMREARQLRGQDEPEAAERLMAEAKQMRERVARLTAERNAKREPGEETARQLHELQAKMRDAQREGKSEVVEQLHKKMRGLMQRSGAGAQQKMDQHGAEMFERKIHELREQGKNEMADRLVEHMKRMRDTHARAVKKKDVEKEGIAKREAAHRSRQPRAAQRKPRQREWWCA